MNPSMNTTTHTAELIDSFTAAHVDRGISIDLTHRRNRPTTKGPISPLCRKLIEVVPMTAFMSFVKGLGAVAPFLIFKRDKHWVLGLTRTVLSERSRRRVS